MGGASTSTTAGDTAIDEGVLRWETHGSMTGANSETISATGRRVRCREGDVVTVENGVVTSHRFYFDCRTGSRSSVSRRSPGVALGAWFSGH